MIDFIIVIIYLIISGIIAISVSRRDFSVNSWAMGGGSYNKWMICITLSAAFIGGGFTIGVSEKAYKYGMIFVIAIWGFSIKEVVIAQFIAPRIKRFIGKAKTAGDIIEFGFGENAKIITGIASFIICSGIIGAQLVSCGNIFTTFFPDISPVVGTIIIAVLILIYILIGGFKAVVSLDILHFSIIMIMIPVIMIFCILSVESINLESVISKPDLSGMELTAIPISILMISFFLGESLVPPYIQRLLIGKDEKETQKGTYYSALLSMLFFTMICIIGVMAYQYNHEILPHTSLPYMIDNVMPIGLKGLSIAALIAVILSSCNSFTNSTVVAVYNDIIYVKFPKLDQYGVLIMRTLTFLLIAMATLFALSSESALDILLSSYKFWTPMILPPLIMSIFGMRSSFCAFIISSILSVVSMVLYDYYSLFSIGIEGSLENVIFGTIIDIISLLTIHYLFIKDKYKAI